MSLDTETVERDPLECASPDQAQAANVLFPPLGERKRVEDRLTADLIAACTEMCGGPVVPDFDREKFHRALRGFDFGAPRKLDEVLGWTIQQMLHGIVHVNHPRYFGLFNPAPTFPAQCADRIAAAFNPQLASAVTSPAAVAIEAHTISAVAERAGLPAETIGHFTSGGSEANYTAVICALTHACPGYGDRGVRAFTGAPVFYVSRESHLAWIKIAHQAGIGRTAARMIATDGRGRMDRDALMDAIRMDCAAGNVPFMIAATAGTTNAGMVDPLHACAAIAKAEGIWYHVDAAWGGAALASNRLRRLLSGMELADSVTIDAHKWFATTMGCGMFMTARPAVLPAAFHIAANFMPPAGALLDPYVSSAQWSRRFAGLRLFLSLAAGGWAAYERHVEQSVALAADLAEKLPRAGWTVLNEPSLGVVCAVPPTGSKDVRSLVSRVVASGQAWVSAASFEGQDAVRACISNGETTREDVDALVQTLGRHLHA